MTPFWDGSPRYSKKPDTFCPDRLWRAMASPNLLQPRAKFPRNFGESLREARRARRWSQARLAERVGVTRDTILRIEKGHAQPGPHLVRALLRTEVLGAHLPKVHGWEPFDEPDRSRRGFRAYAARITAGLTLAEVAQAAGTSAASLSHFERDLAAPKAIVGPKALEHPGVVKDQYAKLLGFADAADMTDYIEADDPLPWLEWIGESRELELPPAACMPVARQREPDEEVDELTKDLLACL
ncbi:helix-turn-helix domain-containing protein [Sphingomonas sp. NPDC079357]|uniref:helix-turn-helix domain-containing protein n=1 Tax=Sphingomonas sp. NPDC079357 TaxID=3364518 RepID=UPI00384BED02